MPPKPKYTREELIKAALELTRECGIDAVVARNLGNKLGVAPSTIFTHYESVEEIRQAVLEAARGIYNGYVEEGLRMTPPMKGFGVQYIRFAMEEHNLFILLFMQKREGFKMVDFIITEGHYERIIQAAQTDFLLVREQAELLYHNMFTYALGIAAMSATGVCRFSIEEIAQMLGMTCRSMLIGMKMPRDEREKAMPQMGRPMQGSVESYMMADEKKNEQD
ncbi:MAG: TetR/AcrR family transcriptional regulator [Lachnospiraceae bacterium]|nr:TetR/AcrR family transcriptional regulator [Lachnospiraceae bacterium]